MGDDGIRDLGGSFVTGGHAGESRPTAMPRRHWKAPLLAAVIPAGLYSVITILFIAAAEGSLGEGWWLRVLQSATALGRGVIDHLGWMFGILVAIQLGSLFALIGGHILTRDRREEAMLRSFLEFLSLFPVVALSPAFTLAAIAALRVGELRGALLVIVPALLLTACLGIFIGTFEPADELAQLEFAEERKVRACQAIDDLEGCPSARPWRTTSIVSGVLVLLALGVPLLVLTVVWNASLPGWIYEASSVLVLTVVPLTVFTVTGVSGALKPTLNAFQIAFSVYVMVATFLLNIAVLFMLLLVAWPVGLGMFIVGVFLGAEMVRVVLEAREVRAHRDPSGYWRSGGLLARAGTSVALQSAKKDHGEAEKTIAELKEKINSLVEQSTFSGGQHRRDGVETEAPGNLM